MSSAARLERPKTSDSVAAFLLSEFVGGRLRPGDRIDLGEVADALGVSRQPVREALVLLERDAVVRMPFHRGAFLGDIDAAAVREAFTWYAALSGVTARSATASGRIEALAAAAAAAERAMESVRPMEYEVHAREFRRLLNRLGGGAQVRALLRTFTGLVVAVSSAAVEADLAAEQSLISAELAALLSGSPAATAQAAVAHVQATGERGIGVLVERGAIELEEAGAADAPAATRASALQRMVTTLGQEDE